MNFNFRKARDFGDLITDTFQFVKLTWKPLFKSIFTICGIFMLFGLAADVAYRLQMGNFLSADESGSEISPRIAIFGTAYVLYLLAYLLQYIMFILTTLCFVAVYRAKGDVAPTVEEVWTYVKFYFFRFIGASFLLCLIYALGIVLCIIPGTSLSPILSLTTACLVLENASFSFSLSRGYELIKDNWWLTFGALFVVGLIGSLINGVGSVPGTLVMVLGTFAPEWKSLSVWLTVIGSVIAHLCSVALILPTITSAMSYFSLAEKKEGVGLAERMNEFGKSHPETPISDEEY